MEHDTTEDEMEEDEEDEKEATEEAEEEEVESPEGIVPSVKMSILRGNSARERKEDFHVESPATLPIPPPSSD